MNFETRIRELQDQIAEAEKCRGECRHDSPEGEALGHVIAALEAVLSLLRSLALIFQVGPK